MIKRYLRIIAFVSMLGFSFQAFAVVPLALWIAGISSAGSGISMETALGLSLAAHAGVLAIALNNSSASPASAVASAPITINLDPNVPLKTPPNWTPPVAPATQPTPPNAASQDKLFKYPANGQYGSGNEVVGVCQQIAGSSLPTSVGTSWTYKSSTNVGTNATCTYSRIQTSNGAVISDYTINLDVTIVGCPTGYTQSGNNCTLSAPELVMKPADSQCTIVRVGNSFSGDSKDPDCLLPSSLTPNAVLDIQPSKVTATQSGVKLEIKINADGSTTATESKDVNGKTVTSIINIGQDGKPTGTKQETTDGTGDLNTPASTGGTGQNLDISSLNKEATQSAIKSDTAAIKDALTTAPTADNSLSDKKTEYDTAATAHGNALKGIGDGGLDSHGLSWSWFPDIPTGSCSPYSYSIAGHNNTLDYCPTIEKIRDVFGWILYITTGVTLFYIFTGRRDES